VANLNSCELIGCRRKNIGRYFLSVGPLPLKTSKCFTPVYRPIYRTGKSAGKSADLPASGAAALASSACMAAVQLRQASWPAKFNHEMLSPRGPPFFIVRSWYQPRWLGAARHAVTGRGSRILQGRVSNPSERGSSAEKELGLAGGCTPSSENFGISYIKMVSFYAFPVIFVDTVAANRYERKPSHLSCRKINKCTFVGFMLIAVSKSME